MTDIIEAIKATKDVMIEVSLNSMSIWVKADKQELLEQLAFFTANAKYNDIVNELEIVSQYGTSAIYLAKKLA